MKELSFGQRIQLLVFGRVRVGERMRSGWKEPVPLYAFYCEEHGLVMNIPRGWWSKNSPHIPVGYKGVISALCCPLCVEKTYKYV